MSNIIINRTRELEFSPGKILMKGHFLVQLIRRGIIIKELSFDNLITNAGLDIFGTTTVSGNYCGVGTGATAPANTDTTLGAELTGGSNARVNFASSGISDVITTGAGNAYRQLERTYLFLEPNSNGNLTEIGIFQNSTGTPMWARQLFKDGLGNPIVLTKTAADQLRIKYTVRLYPPADVVSSVTINSVSYNYTIRGFAFTQSRWVPFVNSFYGAGVSGANALISDGTLGALTDTTYNGSNLSFGSSETASAYVSGNYYVDHALVLDPGVANFVAGIGQIIFAPLNTNQSSMFQIGFTTTKIPKTNVQRLTMNYRASWGRYP